MDQKDEVKSKVDIVEVISSYVPLKKAGRNFAGLCPFHSEKTPSFMVSPDRQVFKCFGCGVSGDVFSFLEKVEGWGFRETLEELAKRVGVKLVTSVPTARGKEKEKLIEIHKLAAKFYSYLLTDHKVGNVARTYLEKRGIKKDIWQKYGLGYAPGGWENLRDFFVKHGFGSDDVAGSGLVIARQGRDVSYYDRFRNRLVFPLKDDKGVVLGFSGRVIGQETNNEPKYVNSPETLIFNKGSLLFGMDIAKSAIRQKDEAILVEGEFDALSLFQAGYENVVASKGTALTEKQVVILSRICSNVALCFDADLAGDAAARRGIELLDASGINVRVVGLNEFKDPDEFAQKDPKGLVDALKNAQNVYEFFLKSATSRYNPKSVDGKRKIGQEIIPVVAKITDDIVRAHFIDRISKELDLDSSLVASAVEKKTPINLDEKVPQILAEETKKVISLEEYFLGLFLIQNRPAKQFYELLDVGDFKDGEAQSFWKWLRVIMSNSKYPGITKALVELPETLGSFVDGLYLINAAPAFSDKELWAGEVIKAAARIKEIALKRKLKKLSIRIKVAEENADLVLISKLAQKFDSMSRKLKEKII